MTCVALDTTVENAAFGPATPRMSVLIPFYRYDPRPLVRTLDNQARDFPGQVEIVLLDDGGGDPALTVEMTKMISKMSTPARLVTLAENQGRSSGRNRLFGQSRARHVLFIDSDMAPDSESFLRTWLELAEQHDPAIAFGGFSLKQVTPRADQRLHYALQQRGECVHAAQRTLAPAKYVYTSNLLVRRDAFETEAFDDHFSGWGWEDVEWGIRISYQFDITHIDNPATHLGLDTAPVLLDKYAKSLANFTKVLARHPDVLSTYPSYRLSRLLRRAPFRNSLRRLLRDIAQSGAPLFARIVAAKFYRAAVYAEART